MRSGVNFSANTSPTGFCSAKSEIHPRRQGTPQPSFRISLNLRFSSSERADFGLRLYFQVKIRSTFAKNRMNVQVGHERCFFSSDRTRRGSNWFALQTLNCNLDGSFVFSSVLISNWGEPACCWNEKLDGGGVDCGAPGEPAISSFVRHRTSMGIYISTVKSAQPCVIRCR